MRCLCYSSLLGPEAGSRALCGASNGLSLLRALTGPSKGVWPFSILRSIMLRSFESNFLGSCLYLVGFYPLEMKSRLGQTHKHAGSWCENGRAATGGVPSAKPRRERTEIGTEQSASAVSAPGQRVPGSMSTWPSKETYLFELHQDIFPRAAGKKKTRV